MPISPNSGSEISLSEAQELVGAFRSKFSKEIKASFVGIETLNKILSQEDCIGVRIYNGHHTELGRLSPVLVGVDSKGKDMTNGFIFDRLIPCPSYCDTESELFCK
ncbi:hypothetical protein FIA58_012715 [Flavobacterium jejuense]|uniref:Uncharacterized protein n=1 Tax=Flavobacterium jejuense TaxID=1544455 RepID=A0ABX0ISJ7_9FLAO|nr:hypothetical protein [Flavobacterium jejuense]NHN26541.1 hypothetical protein [Flavobacterium jejuense]